MSQITSKCYQYVVDKLANMKEGLNKVSRDKAESALGQDGWHDEGFQRGKVEEVMIADQCNELQALLTTFEVVEPENQNDTVKLGNRVGVKYDGEDQIEYLVVDGYPIQTADTSTSFISTLSPLGKALLGKQVGDTILIKVEGRNINITVEEIFSPSK